MAGFGKWNSGKAWGIPVRKRSNCKEELMCGVIPGYPCVKATTLHRENTYGAEEGDYALSQLRRAVSRLRPHRDQNGVGCSHPLLLESRRTQGRLIIRKQKKRHGNG